ncbi:FliM/FliN family flagellar motor switch protein [Aureimonas endophytica]|nr:FliM/FliN family flagellar motor switch protein [Aureimonas endophytica]
MTAERTIEAQIRSASRIEPHKLPRLKLLGEEWAEAATKDFAEFCGGGLSAEFAGVAPLTIGAGAPEARDAALCLMLRSPQWTEIGFVLGDAMAADLFAEAIFGGPGRSRASAGSMQRALTALDKRLAEKGLATFAEAANPVFAEIAPLDLKSDLFVSTAIPEELDELLPADGRGFIVLTFRLRLGDVSASLRACLPEKAFAMHRRKLATVPERAAPAADETWAKNIQEGLQLADLEVRALLDERQITLGEVSRFAVGQTIVLDATMDSLIVVECEEQRLFRGRMGMTRDAYVVRIEEKIDPTEEFIDDILAD